MVTIHVNRWSTDPFPIFTNHSINILPDGRYLITTLTHQIRVYFVSTRQCIKTIDIDLSDLVDLKLDVTNPNHAILLKVLEKLSLLIIKIN